MPNATITRPPDLRCWEAPDDDVPFVPEAPLPPWPLVLDDLASAQARRAFRADSDGGTRS